MIPYKDAYGESGIVSYEFGHDSILVTFKNGTFRTYKYTYQKPGIQEVDHMKFLARQGEGLHSFIKSVVKDKYESRW